MRATLLHDRRIYRNIDYDLRCLAKIIVLPLSGIFLMKYELDGIDYKCQGECFHTVNIAN